MISPGVILSAAHCGNYDGDSVIVGAFRAGSTTHGAVRRAVAETRFHPNYRPSTEQNDFMLLRLQSSVNMNGNVELMLNDETGVPQNNQRLTVLGLGDLSENGNSPNFLRDVVVRAIPTNKCNSRNSYDGEVDGNTMLCAGT